MRHWEVTTHPKYGEPLHLIGRNKLKIWALVGTAIFVVALIFGYFNSGPESFSLFETLVLAAFVLFLVGVGIREILRDEKDVHLIIYAHGVWSQNRIIGTNDNFVPWVDINRLEKQNTTVQTRIIEYIVMHVIDKQKYNHGVNWFTKLMYYRPRLYGNPFIIVNALDIKIDDLFDLMNQQLTRSKPQDRPSDDVEWRSERRWGLEPT